MFVYRGEGRKRDGLDLVGCLRSWTGGKDMKEEEIEGGGKREGRKGRGERKEGSGALPT